MALDNNTNLIKQICTASGLTGKELEDLKARLAQLSAAELQAELTKALAGNNLYGDMGLRVEKTVVQKITTEQEEQLKSALSARLNAVSTNVKKAEDSNGFLGKAWSWTKNTFNFGDSSDKVREQQKADLKALENGNIKEAFKQITGLDYTVENVNKFLNNEVQTKSETALNGYTEGQKMALDVGADMVSGILAVGALALAPVTGGASILIAAGVGAATKVTIKALAPGEYSMKDLAYDSITGSINGALAPITNGLGGAVGTGVAKFFGLEALESTAKTALSQAVKHAGKEVVEEVAEEAVEQGGKSLLTRILAKQGSEYVLKEGAEKTLKTTVGKVTAYTADMMVDGSLSGAGDGFARALAEGRFEDIPQDMLQGFIGGAIASPFIGGGFRLAGKAGSTVLNKINNKITFSSVLPDGTSTKFGQGQVGDCPLLSMIDGFLANDRTKGLLTNAIQTDVNGNFAVKIGDKTVTVLRSSLTDEMLADQSGIRIFEQAYKQIAGDLDGGFADVVAKYFGLNPLHITSDNITDEVLERIAKDSDNYVLSLGVRINAEGVVTPDGEFQHYFSIKNIDSKTKTVTLVDTYDTSKTLTMSFDDVKTQGISIDGGSVGKTDLPNSVRNTDNVKFRGEDEASSQQAHDMGYRSDELALKMQSLKDVIEDKELLEIRLKELFGMAENEKLHDMYDFQLKEIVSIIDKENIVLLESILKRNDIQTWDVQDLLKSCCNNSEKANKLKHLLSLKRQEENVFKAYTCTTLVENDYDEALLNKMLLKEVNGNYKYDGDYISQALQLCTGSKEKTWAMNQIIEKDFNIYSYNLNEWLSLISPENMGIILYLKEIKLNDFDLQECLKFCKSTEEQLPKLQEINTRIDISGPQKLEMIKNSLKNSELTELLYKDSRFLEDSWTTTAIISKYDSAKEMVDFLLRQKNIDNPEFLKYNPSEILDFINSSLTISDLTPATLKMIDDIKALKFEGEQLFSKPVTFIETLKNNKEYEFIWTDILQNIKNGNLQLENGIFVKNIIENFKNIPENYQTKILNLFLGENKKLSVYNLSKIISANQKDNIFNNPFKLKVFDDLLSRIQKEDFTNTKDLNCIDELLSSILGPTQVNWYLKLIEYNQINNSRFSLTDINEIIKKCHSIDEESFDRFLNYKETDGVTPRFTGSEISNLLNYSGFWLDKFESVAGLKNSDGTYKFNGEAIYALLRLGDRTKESGIYDMLLSIEVDGKAKFQGKSCEDLLNLTFQLRKDARELLLDLMENQNISEKVLLKIFEADYPGGPILVKDIPWEEFAKYGLLENSNGEVNHKLIQTLKYYWSGDTSYVEKMMSMTSQSLETMNYMKNISKEGLNEVSWYKQILEKANQMSDAEIKFYFDFGKQAIYDNYHGRWSELNDNKINVTNNFLSSLLDSKTVLTLDSFSVSEKITLLNYLKDIDIADFKSPNSFSAFLQKYTSTDELKRHIMKDLEVSLKHPGKDIIIPQGHINKLLKGEFSGLKEKYPFITNDVIAKYNKIMLKTNNLEGLTSKDQVVLKFAVLFEKINSDETLNSIIARNILENNGMTADISERVFNLLKNKNWLTMYKEGKLDINDIAVLFREPNDLEIAKLLCAEDFLNETNRSIIKEVETTLNNIYSTAPIVKPTTIPYEQRYLTRLLHDGTEYKIIDFTDPNLNLSALGFSKELNSENIRFLTHFINIEGQDSRMSGSSTELINLLCDEMNNTSLSVALINPNHIDIDVMGRNCAVILEPMGSNYAAAFHEDFTSPLKKGFQEFKEYLTGKLTPEKRVYVSNVYKKLLNLNDSEYVEFYKAISGLKDISNIKSDITINKGLSTERVIPKEEVISAINSAHNSLTNVTGNWNELIIYNPKIKALLYKIETDVQDNLLENCPKDILDFAKKHNIPIVITK